MRLVIRFLIVVLALGAFCFGAAFYFAGRAAEPAIQIERPTKLLGRTGTLDVTIESPGARLDDVTVAVTQDGKSLPVLQLPHLGDGGAPSLDAETKLTQESADRIRLTRALDRQLLPGLHEGKATITVSAKRPVLYGLRVKEASATREVEVRLTPPKVSVLSTHHYINHGGAEMVVYRVDPAGAESGVRVGQVTYPGYPASGAVMAADPTIKAAFFALLYDQDLNTPIEIFARDEAGNQARGSFDYRVFEKPFRKSRIDVDTRFMQRVLPEIADHTPEVRVASSSADDLLKAYLVANGEVRRKNAAQIKELAKKTAPTILWNGAFVQLGNSQVESAFADQRTYFFEGREIDRQVHLGFDLAVTSNVPIAAANAGRIVYADYLGIYGNCVVIDHGMGVQSLYGHLSSIGVKVDQDVTKGQEVGRSGMTGLAGGDHLHFTMLVDGNMVSPVEWWDQHWIDDRIVRKLKGS